MSLLLVSGPPYKQWSYHCCVSHGSCLALHKQVSNERATFCFSVSMKGYNRSDEISCRICGWYCISFFFFLRLRRPASISVCLAPVSLNFPLPPPPLVLLFFHFDVSPFFYAISFLFNLILPLTRRSFLLLIYPFLLSLPF
jgi:hypothetical protein